MGAYQGWAIVEIMGHRRHVGIVSEVVQYGATMLCVEAVVAQDIEQREPFFYGGSAVFGVKPLTEEQARAAVAPPVWAQLRAAPSPDPASVNDADESDDGGEDEVPWP